jgi:hypothetical protein
VALDIDSVEHRDLEALRKNGWILADPREIARDPDVYRRYIQSSKAEFMATKGIYVQTNSGWFSERSICYLASGKPVIAQDTGLRHLYPTGLGLLTFSSLDEAVAAADSVNSRYDLHCRAARMIAEEYFDSSRVISKLLSTLSAGPAWKAGRSVGTA